MSLVFPYLGGCELPSGKGHLHCFMATIPHLEATSPPAELVAFLYQIMHQEGRLIGESAVLVYIFTTTSVLPAYASHETHKSAGDLQYPADELISLLLGLLKIDRESNPNHLVLSVDLVDGKISKGISRELPGPLTVPNLPTDPDGSIIPPILGDMVRVSSGIDLA